MSEASVIFTLDGINLIIQCALGDKMKDICKNYSAKINKNMNSLLFLYKGNKVNFELSFKEQANYLDKNNHQMKILVSKCDEKNILNSEKIDEIILTNNKIKNDIIDIKLKIDNIIMTSSNNSLNIQLKNINNKDIKNNNEKINNLLSEYIAKKNINYSIGKLNRNLLGNIKSIYFYRILFLHLNEKIKLKVIKYNKKLQKNIDIKLINYKFYSERYIIYETKFKGKEYDGYNNNLVFEGEYLNGKRNGKGKEYYYGDLKFEGEYLNGKRNGKGKEYGTFGDLKFEGEYLNGKINGR